MNIEKAKMIIKMILRYPKETAKEKAYIRWYITNSERKRYNYPLLENEIVFDVGGVFG